MENRDIRRLRRFAQRSDAKSVKAERAAIRKLEEERHALKRLRREYQKRMGEVFYDPRWADLFGDNKFVLIDVGAQGGLEKEWRKVRPLLKVMAVEPRTKLGEGLTDADFEVTILNVALDSQSGERELYLAASMSSFLRPDLQVCNQFGFNPKTPMERSRVKTTTLDEIVKNQQLRFVDFIKLDTQGTELDIIRGGMMTISEMAVAMRVEVSFCRLYESQPLFGDVDAYVRPQGFDFIDLMHFVRRRHVWTGDADKTAVQVADGQLLQADALYFRTPARVKTQLEKFTGADRIRYMAGVLVACLTYGKLDLAARCIHDASSLIEPISRAVMLELLRCAVPRNQPSGTLSELTRKSGRFWRNVSWLGVVF